MTMKWSRLFLDHIGHKCLMAKDDKKKVKSRSSNKYATSSDEVSSSDDEDNLLTLFANLNMQQKEKLNELISAIHEKDELLDTQEDFLIKENKKHVKVKNAYTLEVEKCEKLSSELSTCHDVISNLRNENAKLIAKVEKSNVCDDSIDNLRNDNASSIAKIEKLNASLASLRNENEKLIAKAKELDVCNCRRFETGGSLCRRVKMSPRAPA
jgi:DNA repair exonuclease SbcCD ATPase subunit